MKSNLSPFLIRRIVYGLVFCGEEKIILAHARQRGEEDLPVPLGARAPPPSLL
jgi:hypothetical protein